ncbi:MAG TPA: DUF488 domain-containing protein [Noviherbaspirillum sp.]
MTNQEVATAFSIGFTEKSAERFFTLLRGAGVTRLIDVRLNNTSQLAGFAKKEDLRFFVKEICSIDYVEVGDLAPEPGPLKEYKNKLMDWQRYEDLYLNLLARRAVEKKLDRSLLNGGCLLCSEHKPHQCHRRLALEYLKQQWDGGLNIKHLY